MTEEVEAAPVVRVARDLTEIERLHGELLTEAVAKANDPLMPGGSAMVALGPVANLEAWENLNQASERLARAYTSAEDEDPEQSWSAFQLLEFWSEAWRREHGAEYDQRPTIASEANFIRWALNWAWDNEPGWDEFAADVRKARVKLEDILAEGHRTERGVPCLSCNVELIRPTAKRRDVKWCDGHEGVCHLPHDRCPHDRGGLRDEWHCPECERRYDVEGYQRAVSHAHFLNAEWLPIEGCAARTGEREGTIKVWASRGYVRRRLDLNTGRTTYRVADIEARVAS